MATVAIPVNLDKSSNAELLSSIAGPREGTAIIARFGNLTNLAHATFEDLLDIPGVGLGKARAVKSAFLLSQRLARESYAAAPLLDTPEKVADLLREENRLYTVEHLQVALLDTRRHLIAVVDIAHGTLDSVLVQAREVFAPAILKRATSLILVHNHPSGNPEPSEADIRVTREMVRAGRLLRIEVADHIIIGRPIEGRPRDDVSLRELGCMHE